jgi:hypothetical protein
LLEDIDFPPRIFVFEIGESSVDIIPTSEVVGVADLVLNKGKRSASRYIFTKRKGGKAFLWSH